MFRFRLHSPGNSSTQFQHRTLGSGDQVGHAKPSRSDRCCRCVHSEWLFLTGALEKMFMKIKMCGNRRMSRARCTHVKEYRFLDQIFFSPLWENLPSHAGVGTAWEVTGENVSRGGNDYNHANIWALKKICIKDYCETKLIRIELLIYVPFSYLLIIGKWISFS